METSRGAPKTRPVFIVIGVLIIVWLLIEMFPFSRADWGEIRKTNCRENLNQIGKAMAVYREDNGGYFPFSWQRAGDAEPLGDGAAKAAMAATSLGNLYPRYVQFPKLFHCPSTEDQPSFVLNLPWQYRTANRLKLRTPPEGSNWTVAGKQPGRASSYGYDPRISPRAPSGHAVAADMDGSWQNNHDTSTQNHEGGQNVLYVDGSVKWQGTNYCSNDPNDNIFAEDRWDADTDSHLVYTDASLSVSFDGYKHLHYPR